MTFQLVSKELMALKNDRAYLPIYTIDARNGDITVTSSLNRSSHLLVLHRIEEFDYWKLEPLNED